MSKPADTEQKDAWYEFGEKREQAFVSAVAPNIGLDANINPEKDQKDHALDLVVDDVYADLKTQETPFFKAETKYGVPPQYAVTFNMNDYRRYKRKEHGFEIYYWVRWAGEEAYGYSVEQMEGVWSIGFERLRSLIENGRFSKHAYRRRQNERRDGNSRRSYVLDLRLMTFRGAKRESWLSTKQVLQRYNE